MQPKIFGGLSFCCFPGPAKLVFMCFKRCHTCNKEKTNAMTLSTPSKKPSREAHSSPRSVTGLVLEEPEDVMKEVAPQVRPKTRMQELEEKRLALRRQCAHLQQQLHAFSARCADSKIDATEVPTVAEAGKDEAAQSDKSKPEVAAEQAKRAADSSAQKREQTITHKSETKVAPSYTVENVFWQDEHGNEATYSGPLNAQKVPHGRGGRMVYEDGSVVEGEFQDGKAHGEASYIGSDGCTYTGKSCVVQRITSK